MIRVMVIEDEPNIRKLLKKMIEKEEDFQVVAEADKMMDAVREFAANHPQVVFADVDLNGESGMECAKMLTELDPKIKVIFATAHSEYMADAFEIYAFDYLLKPFNLERVHQTLTRIKKVLDAEDYQNTRLQEIREDEIVIKPDSYKEKLMVKGKEQISLIDVHDIILIERVDHATRILAEKEEYRTGVALTDLEEKLNPAEFMRCHKSYIINVLKITHIEPYGRWTYVVHFKDTKETALMTAQKYEELKDLFQ